MSIEILERFYDKLYNNIIKMKKKVTQDSIIFSFLETNSNRRYTLLRKSSSSSERIPDKLLDELLEEDLIRGTDEPDNYTITAKGIWKIEKHKQVINENSIIEYFDKNYFNPYKIGKEALTDKEKVILLSMIAIRSFSQQSPVDLRKEETVMDIWKELTDKTCEKLASLGLTKTLTEKSLYGKVGNEHPVSSLFRRAQKLPRKTKGLYKTTGDHKYFLDLYDKSGLSKKHLSYLFAQLMKDDELSYSDRTELLDFCNDITYDKSIYVFDLDKHIFSNPEYDDIIKDTLLSL